MATVRMTYTLDHLADTQAREVSRARALAWVARGWRNEKQVLAEVEANARAAENHTAILRGMFASLTVQAGS